MKQFHWLSYAAKNCDWSMKVTPLSNLIERRFFEKTGELTAKAELNCEIYKSYRKCWKSQVSFIIRAAL